MDKVTFISKYFVEPSPEQKAFLSDPTPGKFRTWARQSGKTRTGLLSCLHTAYVLGKPALFVSQSYSSGQLKKQMLLDICPAWIHDFAIEKDTPTEIVFKNGGRIVFVAQSSDPRGQSFAEIFLDDYRQYDDYDQLKRNLYPLLVSTGGSINGLSS